MITIYMVCANYVGSLLLWCMFFLCDGVHRNLNFLPHSFPTRRTTELRHTLATLASHEVVAVNAHEAFTEIVFKGLEWLDQQHLAALVTQGHVFMVGDKIDHLIQRDQFDALDRKSTRLNSSH